MDTTPRIVTCPTCGRRVKWTSSNPHRPFCSDRCRLIDLGAWAGENHRIPGKEQDDVRSDGLEHYVRSDGLERRTRSDELEG